MRHSIFKTIAIAKCLSVVMVFLMLFFIGCRKKPANVSKPLDFHLCDSTMVPDTFMEIIEEKKDEQFKISYACNDCIYIAVGYGLQSTNDRMVCLEELKINDRAIFISTGLYTKNHSFDPTYASEASICPYIVIRCNVSNIPVYYDM